MKPVTRILQNGMKAVLIPHEVKTVTACIRGLAGSNLETASQIGVAHMLEHVSMLNAKQTQLAKNTLLNGGRFTGTTSRDDVAFFAKVLKKDYVSALEFLNNCLQPTNLTQNEIDNAKSTVIQEIMLNEENPVKHIYRMSYQNLYPGQRMAIYNTGNTKHVKDIKLKVLEYFRDTYYTPSNFVLSVCGKINEELFFRQANKIFSKIPNNLNETKMPSLKITPCQEFKVKVENRKNINMTYLKIDLHGFKTSETNKYPSFLISYLLKARLQESLKCYALDVLSFSSNTYGLFSVVTAVKKELLENTLKTICSEFNEISLKDMSISELNYAKNKMLAEFEFSMEKTSLRADFFSEFYLYKQVVNDHQKEIEKYQNCSVEDIRNTANLLFAQKLKVAVIDKDLTEEQLTSHVNQLRS